MAAETPLTGAQHFAKAAEILADVESTWDSSKGVTIVGHQLREDALRRAELHAMLAQASATAHADDKVADGVYGIPGSPYRSGRNRVDDYSRARY